MAIRQPRWLWISAIRASGRGTGGPGPSLDSLNVDFMIAANLDADPAREIVGDFGGFGLWLWDGTDWTLRLDPRNAEYLIAADTDNDGPDQLFVNFGADGLWSWNAGKWAQGSLELPLGHDPGEP